MTPTKNGLPYFIILDNSLAPLIYEVYLIKIIPCSFESDVMIIYPVRS